jgi:hypothetical protein
MRMVAGGLVPIDGPLSLPYTGLKLQLRFSFVIGVRTPRPTNIPANLREGRRKRNLLDLKAADEPYEPE